MLGADPRRRTSVRVAAHSNMRIWRDPSSGITRHAFFWRSVILKTQRPRSPAARVAHSTPSTLPLGHPALPPCCPIPDVMAETQPNRALCAKLSLSSADGGGRQESPGSFHPAVRVAPLQSAGLLLVLVQSARSVPFQPRSPAAPLPGRCCASSCRPSL